MLKVTKNAFCRGLHHTLLKDRPIILMELIGKSDKSGFRDENELRESLYPEHELFSLRGNRRAKLTPFDWNREEAVCLPQERADSFRHIMSTTGRFCKLFRSDNPT